MDPNFSLSVHLRAEKAKATKLSKQLNKESKRKREEWLSMGAPAQQDYALFLEEREYEKQKRLKQEQKMFDRVCNKMNSHTSSLSYFFFHILYFLLQYTLYSSLLLLILTYTRYPLHTPPATKRS